MQSWLAGRVISYLMRRTRAGDVRPTLALDAPEVILTFPGQNSWSGTFRGRAAVAAWLRRLGGGRRSGGHRGRGRRGRDRPAQRVSRLRRPSSAPRLA